MAPFLGKNKKMRLSSSRSQNKNFSCIPDSMFPNILIILFKSEYICTQSASTLFKTFKSEYLCKISTSALRVAHQLSQNSKKCTEAFHTHDFDSLKRPNLNWSEHTVIQVQKKKDSLQTISKHEIFKKHSLQR